MAFFDRRSSAVYGNEQSSFHNSSNSELILNPQSVLLLSLKSECRPLRRSTALYNHIAALWSRSAALGIRDAALGTRDASLRNGSAALCTRSAAL